MRGCVFRLAGLSITWLATLCYFGVHPAHSQTDNFPSRPVTLIVPFQAGISVDILLRGVAEAAAVHLGQPVIVDNKPGGSATLGPAMMASTAKPDGYTIAQLAMPLFRLPHLQKVSFDPLKDFSWIIQLGGYSIGIVAASSSQFKAWSDVVAYAKANPGKLTYTTAGPVTINSIAMELIARQEGTRFAHVPGKVVVNPTPRSSADTSCSASNLQPGRPWCNRASYGCWRCSTTSAALNGRRLRH